MAVPPLQSTGFDLSLLLSVFSLLISLGILTVYYAEYNQQKDQLAEQRRQIDNQEKQLEAQQQQLKQQEKQLDTQEQELEQYQEELKEIKRQTELAEMEHQPHLEVEDYQFEGDRLLLWLSNYGNGAAINIKLETTFEVDGPDHINPKPVTSRLRRCDGDGDQPLEGQALRFSEQRIEFEGEAIVGTEGPTGELHQQSLRGILLDLQESDTSSTPEIEFQVLAETFTGETHRVSVTDRPISLSLQTGPNPPNLETAATNEPLF